jgi:hypothetical protein
MKAVCVFQKLLHRRTSTFKIEKTFLYSMKKSASDNFFGLTLSPSFLRYIFFRHDRDRDTETTF